MTASSSIVITIGAVMSASADMAATAPSATSDGTDPFLRRSVSSGSHFADVLLLRSGQLCPKSSHAFSIRRLRSALPATDTAITLAQTFVEKCVTCAQFDWYPTIWRPAKRCTPNGMWSDFGLSARHLDALDAEPLDPESDDEPLNPELPDDEPLDPD